MSGHIGWAVAVAVSVGLAVGGSAALAGEAGSVSFQVTSPASTCADAAAASAKSGVHSRDGLAACTEAIENPLLLTRNERAAAYLNRSVLLMAAAQYDAAIADDSAALQLQSDLTEAFTDRGAALMAERRYADAAADYSRALALAPQQPAAVYFDRGLAEEGRGDIKAAYFDYLQAARLNPAWDRPKAELARFSVVGARQS